MQDPLFRIDVAAVGEEWLYPLGADRFLDSPQRPEAPAPRYPLGEDRFEPDPVRFEAPVPLRCASP